MTATASATMADARLPGAPLAGDAPAPLDESQLTRLFSSLYTELRRMARREVRRNGADGVMSTGTLVHEAWIDLSRRPGLAFDQDGRFLAYAARTMRGLVIDRLRARGAQKRGGDCWVTSLNTEHGEQVPQTDDLADIGEALDELAQLEPELARVIELKYFCGFSLQEIAAMEGVCARTIQRRWDKARLLLYQAMRAD